MRRFFVEDADRTAPTITIAGDEFIHLKKVLRLKSGDEVSVFDGRGLELKGVIESVSASSASVRVTSCSERASVGPVEITLLQGLLKGDKPELIIQKATELGVCRICFFLTPRTVPFFDPAKAPDKVQRWRKVAIEAAKQCGRSVLPEIALVPVFRDALKGRDEDLLLVFWEGAGAPPLREALNNASNKSVTVLIGPEGGLTEDELASAEAAGFRKVSLGPRVLRAETAAIAAVSIVQYALEGLG